MERIDLLLINPPFHARNGSSNFFPLGLGYIISSVIKSGFSWRVLDCTKIIQSFFQDDLDRLQRELQRVLEEYSPSIVGIGPCVTSQLRALKIIANCCNDAFQNVPIIAGGPLASIEDQEWLFFDDLGIDHIIIGDGEIAIPDAIRAVKETGNIKNSSMVSWRGNRKVNRIEDVDSIQFPYREAFSADVFSVRRAAKAQQQTQAAMICSRGCPYACFYCVSGNLKANKPARKRSLSNVIDEMEDLYQNYGIDDIVFYDDCFFNTEDKDFDVTTFCNMLCERNLHMTWQIELRPDFVSSLTDNEISLLDQSGCRQINIGVEKVSQKGLNFLGKTSSLMGLRQMNLHIKEISGIKLSGTFILGGSDETKQDILELINTSKMLGLDCVHYNPLFVYPGTPLYQLVFNDRKDWARVIYNDDLPWGEIVFENKHIKRTNLIELVNHAYSTFYADTDYRTQQMIVDRFHIHC